GTDAMRVVDLDVDALRVQTVQVLEDGSHLRDGAVGIEVDEVAVRTLRPTPVDEQLRRQCGDGVGEIDVVVVHRSAQARERTGTANREACRGRVSRLRRQARVSTAL